MNSNKSKNKIASELKTIKLPYFNCEYEVGKLDIFQLQYVFKLSFGANYSRYILPIGNIAEKIINVETNYNDFISHNIKTKLPIVYSHNFNYINFNNFNNNELKGLQQYISEITKEVRYIFEMPKKEAYLECIIDNIDNPNLKNKKKHYKFKKLQRMKMFNQEVVSIFLSLLHKFYWI